MLKKILLALAVVIAGFLAYVATRPDTYHVERSAQVDAPADVVFAQLDDFEAWAAWSPWDKLDPGMNKSYDGPKRAVGASYAWHGNADVGKGKMTITEREPATHIAYRLEFIEPFAGLANTRFDLVPEGDAAVRVTWAMDGDNDFMGKLFGVFMNMDATIGADFERGLASLASASEAALETRAQERARAQAEAQAAADAEADGPAAAAEGDPAP